MNLDEVLSNYLNCFSRLLAVLNIFPFHINQLFALHNFQNIENEICDEFDSWWKQGRELFLVDLTKKVNEIEKSSEQKRYIEAYTLCICLDNKIVYSNTDNMDSISLWTFLPLSKNTPVILSKPLNENYTQTNVAIHPKFDVCKICEYIRTEDGEETTRTRATSIKDAFSGINGQLKNISYTKWQDNDISVVDVIVDCPDSFDGECLTIAFSPMIDKDVVEEDDIIIRVNDMSFDAAHVCGVKESYISEINQRFDNIWAYASYNKADIVFFPEALGTKSLEETQNMYHMSVKSLSDRVMEEGLEPPKLTFMPSFCNNDTNSISVVYQDGRTLGEQIKHRPYVDRNKHKMEAITINSSPTIVVLHMPGVHRIAIMICSDFLTCPMEIQEKMFADLGISLLLISSYSKGEQDFITKLSELKKYGTTVIWGNCCGATEPKRIIGGCSVATHDEICRFSDCSQCDGTCENGCLFLIKLPMQTKRNIREKVLSDGVVKHLLL